MQQDCQQGAQQEDSGTRNCQYGEIHVIDRGNAHLGDVINHNYFQSGRSDEERDRMFSRELLGN